MPKGISSNPSFVKLHTKVTALLALLGVGVPLMLYALGFGVIRLIDIQEEIGIVCVIQADLSRLEDRVNAHIEDDRVRFRSNNAVNYVEDYKKLVQCHTDTINKNNTAITN